MDNKFYLQKVTTHEINKIITKGLIDYNTSIVPVLIPEGFIKFDFAAMNADEKTIGGVIASLNYWGGLDISVLWVAPDFQKQGIGSLLLKKAEEEAKKMGAYIALLDTFDFQAPDFYVKNGYTLAGTIDGFPKGHKRFYFKKEL
jgi:GNAT superfamily N-acetyltransferase